MTMKIIIFLSVLLILQAAGSLGLPYVFIGEILSFIINLTRLGTRIFPEYPSGRIENDAKYDFIVIGSGPSGSVVANRLSENPEWNILLLEAGEEPSWVSDIPLLCGGLEFSEYNWGYKAEPQSGFCRICEDMRLQYPHGNALGGSSIINYMIYTRGNKLDFDRWAAMGNPGWSFDDVLPYFLKSEASYLKTKDNGYHNDDGPLAVSDVPFRSELVDAYVQASQEAGHPYVDYNGRSQLGVSYIQSTTKNGRRSNAENSYLRPIRNRKNIKIQTDSRVTRILINSINKSAYGVEYIHRGRTYRAFSEKEVISSAGSLNSPQLLMLSGIGPRNHLEQLGIDVERDSAVGMNMYDHATFPGIIIELNDSIPINLAQRIINPFTYLKYSDGKGVLTSIGTVEAITYMKTNISTDPDHSYPDMELLMIGVSLASDYGILNRKILNIGSDLYDEFFEPLQSRNAYQVLPTLIHPKSLGRIELRSSNPMDPPKFFANFLSDPENHDVATLIAGIREFQRINQTPTMQKYGATIVKTPLPGCDRMEFDTDEYWECALRSLIGTFYHQTSTCKMGPMDDNTSVVDSRLKVHGINKLRVVDTSVIPVPMSAHTVAVAYMVGEKASDIIKYDWSQSQ